MDAQSALKLREDVRWVLRDNGGFVYFPEDGKIEVLSSTAARIARSLLMGLPAETVLEQLVSVYAEVPRHQLEADL